MPLRGTGVSRHSAAPVDNQAGRDNATLPEPALGQKTARKHALRSVPEMLFPSGALLARFQAIAYSFLSS